MTKYTFFSFPEYGHVNPTLAIVEALIARGDEVVVQELGLGLALDTATLTAEHLRAAVAQVAHDPTFRTGAQARQRTIQEAGGYHRAVEAINSVAHARKQTAHGDLRA
jgi:UDP:flavonoid glycosyltransferase YjiC (YdhE family)